MTVHLYRVSFHHPDNGSSEIIIPLSTASEKEAEEALYLRFNQHFQILAVIELFMF